VPSSSSASSVVASPRSLAAVSARVENRIAVLFDAELIRWRAIDPDLAEPLRSLHRMIEAGGKRLRPAFCYWAFVGAGGDPDDERVAEAGAAFELLHAFALVHDDVMDGSDVRRGQATTHAEFRELHRAHTWRGEARRFGEGAAILIGDLAHVYADLLMDGALNGVAGRAHAEVTPVWHELRLEVNVGQYLDILGTVRGDRDAVTARRIARYKSGKYTIERPLHVGAALVGRLHDLRAPLSAYGDPLGEAFQLRDDVLGVFGDADRTGKPVGQDLREGKPTPLVAEAVTRASDGQSGVLDLIGSPDLDDDDVASIQQVLVDTGALDDIERRIARLTSSAVDVLERAPITSHAQEALAELADFVASRTA
jgi:geranylgeranyl diphosphate synthase, type I